MVTREEYQACLQFLSNPVSFRKCSGVVHDMALSRFRGEIWDEDLVRMCQDCVESYTSQEEEKFKSLEAKFLELDRRVTALEAQKYN